MSEQNLYKRSVGLVTGFFLGLAVGCVTLAATVVSMKGEQRQAKPVAIDYDGRITALEARAEAQAKIRCLNVTTDRMDLAIFPVENLGKKAVKP